MVSLQWTSPDHADAPELPVSLTALVGREAEVEETLELLARPEVRLLTLLGPGGVGKTRLALELAHALRGVPGNEVLWFELSGFREPHLVLDTLGRGLGVPGGGSPEQDLSRHLRDWRGVLVLDNLEQVLGVALPLARLLGQCPHLRLLVTSREPLRVRGEWRYSLGPLALPPGQGAPEQTPATEFFWSCVRRDEPGHVPSPRELGDASALCRALGGLPLALELAASRVGRLGVSGVLAQVQGGRPLSSCGRDLPERHRSLGAVVAWSYDLLTPDEQRVLRHLSVFAEAWDVTSAAAVWPGDTAEEDRLDLALALSDKHLITALLAGDGVAFRLPDTIRAFALARLEESGEADGVWRRLAQSVGAALARLNREVGGARAAQAIAEFTALEHDLRALLRRALSRGEVETVLELAGEAGELWTRANRLTEGRYWLKEARRAGAAFPGRPLTRVLFNLAFLANKQGDYRAAETGFRELLGRVSRTDTPLLYAEVLGNLGVALRGQRQFAEARTIYGECLAVSESLGSRAGVAHSLRNMAVVDELDDQPQAAIGLYGRALSIYRELGSDHYAARTQGRLGALLLETGDTAQGLRSVQEALRALGALRDDLSAACLAITLGRGWQRLGRLAEAREQFEAGLSVLQTVESREEYVLGLEALADFELQTGRPAAAAWCLGQAGALRERFELRPTPQEQALAETTWARTVDLLGAEAATWRGRGAEVPLGEGLAAYHAQTFPVTTRAGGEGHEPGLADEPRPGKPAAGSLSARERQVLACVARGLSNKELCRELGISASTAKTHVAAILSKLEVRTRAQAAARAMQLGLLTDG